MKIMEKYTDDKRAERNYKNKMQGSFSVCVRNYRRGGLYHKYTPLTSFEKKINSNPSDNDFSRHRNKEDD